MIFQGTRTQVVAAGATAGLISRFVIAPLDVVKIRLQLQTHSFRRPTTTTTAITTTATTANVPPAVLHKGTLRTLRHIVETEGVRALWKGNVPAELMYVSYAAVQFTMYRHTSGLLRSMSTAGDTTTTTTTSPTKQLRGGGLPKAAVSFIAGATAGATATAATYPLDLLRTRFAAQVSSRAVYPSLRGAVATIYRDEGGARGFFRGLAPGLAGIVPYMGLFFAMYESARPVFADLPLVTLPLGTSDAAAGVVASVIAKTGVFPLDTVRKRIQVQGPTRAMYGNQDIPEYERGMVRTIRAIVAREGLRGLYRGLVVSLCKAAPASAVTMWTYERTLGLLMSHGIGADRDKKITL